MLLVGLMVLIPANQATEPPKCVSPNVGQWVERSHNSAPTSICVAIDGQPFQLEVARTDEEKRVGLQGRTRLDSRGGMLFPYDSPQALTFWMKACKIPLDMLFFNQGKLVDYVDSAPPCRPQDEPCPLYSAKAPADNVVELKAGTRKKYQFGLHSRLTTCTGKPLDPSP